MNRPFPFLSLRYVYQRNGFTLTNVIISLFGISDNVNALTPNHLCMKLLVNDFEDFTVRMNEI